MGLDYNFLKDHEAHKGKGETPAVAAGVAQQVPWDSWEDITRIGGEVAEVEVKSHTPVRKKAGAKPRIAEVAAAVREYLKQKEVAKAHQRRGSRRPPVMAHWPQKGKKKGRGQKAKQL